MTTAHAFLGLWAETSLHAGAGSSVGGIDLPIQRESHTDWPCVFGSAVKGALRAKAEDKLGANHDSVRWVFGPESTGGAASEHAGALLVGDARLLLLPVRSLTSHFKWVTCPAILRRWQRDGQRLGLIPKFTLPDCRDDTVALTATPLNNDLFLEEYRFTPQPIDCSDLLDHLHQLTGIDRDDLTAQLIIVSDDQFGYFCRYATPVNPHIAINNENKTVKPGALWYEETLPPETVLYVTLSAHPARVKNTLNASQVLNAITQDLLTQAPYLQLGGNETVGMGWCKITVWQSEAS